MKSTRESPELFPVWIVRVERTVLFVYDLRVEFVKILVKITFYRRHRVYDVFDFGRFIFENPEQGQFTFEILTSFDCT